MSLEIQGATNPEILIPGQVNRRSARQHCSSVGPWSRQTGCGMDSDPSASGKPKVGTIRTTDDGRIVGIAAHSAAGFGQSISGH